MSDRSVGQEREERAPEREAPAAPELERSEDEPLKRHGDALLDGTGSRHGEEPDGEPDGAPEPRR